MSLEKSNFLSSLVLRNVGLVVPTFQIGLWVHSDMWVNCVPSFRAIEQPFNMNR